jgi:hypothetical protein
MTEEEAQRHAEGLAKSMSITFHVVRTREGDSCRCNCRPKTARSSLLSSRPRAGIIRRSSKSPGSDAPAGRQDHRPVTVRASGARLRISLGYAPKCESFGGRVAPSQVASVNIGTQRM